MNKPVLVFFLDADIVSRMRAVKTMFPSNWEWGKVIVVTNDSNTLPFTVLEGATTMKLRDFRPDPDTYHVVISNSADADDLACAILRLERMDSQLRVYRYRWCPDRLIELE